MSVSSFECQWMSVYTINGMPSSILLSLTINNWHNSNDSFDQWKDTVLIVL